MTGGAARAALDALIGQEQAGAYLRGVLDSGKVGHAYLFVGPAGSAKMQAATAFAQGIVCEHGGCGACDDCRRIARGSHPDVHVLRPGSAQGYLVGQIRDLIAELGLASVMAKRRVWVLDAAETLTASSANALLKSLEEPPADVVFILLATSADAVLPTILSRCQPVLFRSYDVARTAETLADELAVPVPLVRRALACCASPSEVQGFVRSDDRQEARRRAISCIAQLEHADALDVLVLAREAILAAKAPLSEFKDAQKAVAEDNAKILSASALRELEERQKRELSARERSGIMEAFAAQRSFLRDCLGMAIPTHESPVCDDFAVQARSVADRLGTDRVLMALDALEHARALVERNVSPQLAMESMLFTVKEMFACQQ